MHDLSTPIADFLDATAARKPTPGGGAVTALTGALAAAIGEMVLNYSIGKKGLEAFEGELRPALETLRQHRAALSKAIEDDQAGYAALTAARKLPESSDRAARIKTALNAAIRAPQQMAESAVGILEVCDRIINFVNPYLLSDLAVCADLAMATARCAIYNVRINLANVKDPQERHRIEAIIGQILTRSAGLIHQVAPRVWDRLQQATG